MAPAEELSISECVRLLRSGVTGRVAVWGLDGPYVLPLNYSVLEDAVVLCTTPTSVLGIHGADSQAAFEVDYFNYARQVGWSVMVRGHLELLTEADVLDRGIRNWQPRPWASGPRTLYLQLRWTEISGRKLGHAWDHIGELPVDRHVGTGDPLR